MSIVLRYNKIEGLINQYLNVLVEKHIICKDKGENIFNDILVSCKDMIWIGERINKNQLKFNLAYIISKSIVTSDIVKESEIDKIYIVYILKTLGCSNSMIHKYASLSSKEIQYSIEFINDWGIDIIC